MGKWMQTTIIALVLLVFVLVGIITLNRNKHTNPDRSAQTIQSLEEQIQQMTLERGQREQEWDTARREAQTLQGRLLAQEDQRKADQQVMQELWDLITGKTRSASKTVQAKVDPNAPGSHLDADATERTEEDTLAYDFQAVKEIINAADGDIDAVVHQIVTAQGIERMLREHGDRPAYWTEAARLAGDPQAALAYLQEGVRLHPESPEILTALVQAQITAGAVDESTLTYVNELERIDPTNALGDCYTAYCQFANGDAQGALQSLSEASAKGRFADGQIEAMMSRYDYLLNEGVSDDMALSMSFFSMPVDQWGTIRQVAMQSLGQARVLADTGQYDSALKITQDVSSLGSMISSSGRFFINDLIGIALQKAGLNQQRTIHEILGHTPQVLEVDERLTAINDRTTQMQTMGQTFGAVMDTMNEDDLAGFVDGAILNGGFATMQDIPEVSEALKQAREMEQTQVSKGEIN
jgi:hypothetical protein